MGSSFATNSKRFIRKEGLCMLLLDLVKETAMDWKDAQVLANLVYFLCLFVGRTRGQGNVYSGNTELYCWYLFGEGTLVN